MATKIKLLTILATLLSLSYSTAAQDRKTENAYHSRAKTKIADKRPVSPITQRLLKISVL